MPAFRAGQVTEIVLQRGAIQKALVVLDDGRSQIKVTCYAATGTLVTGDRVIVNTTGIELGLGTGGEGFVLWIEGRQPPPLEKGHIVKMRYTPWQTEVLAAEAPESPSHERLLAANDLAGCPVVACGLHSQIAGVAAGIKAARPATRVVYAMSDAGALGIAWSDLVHQLRGAGLIDGTLTYGHAFGGDLEAINLFSGLTVARVVGRAEVIIAGMGPGGVGTGTKLGYSGIEQAQILEAAASLGGRSIACVRISFHDERPRHQGISHHSLTSLELVHQPTTIALPELPGKHEGVISEQIGTIDSKHDLVLADGSPGVELLRSKGIEVRSMGRSLDESREGFLAASSAGAIAARMLEVGRRR